MAMAVRLHLQLLAFLFVIGTVAFPDWFHSEQYSNRTAERTRSRRKPIERSQLKRRDDPGPYYRILPLGDSITYGKGSSDGNGYRLRLKNALKDAGKSTDFIGTLADGQNNSDNQHEGWSLNTIQNISDHMKQDHVLRQRPNLILLHAGTNDNNLPDTADGAPDRLATFLDYILCQSSDAVLLVAMIVCNNGQQRLTNYFNSYVEDTVEFRHQKGYKIRPVDMSGVCDDMLDDGIHPNDAGYQFMADRWMEAIDDLPDDWYSAPLPPVALNSAETCDRSALFWAPTLSGKEIKAGTHISGDKGEPVNGGAPTKAWVPQWEDDGLVLIGIGRAGSGVVLADLDGDKKADYLWVNETNGDVYAWLNKGGGLYEPVFDANAIRWGFGDGHGVRFADIDGDGKDDYIILSDDGKMRYFQNRGPLGKVWSWAELGDVNGNWAPPGLTTTSVIFGDVNGDGKDDMAIGQSDGTINFYLAQGDIGTSSFSWLSCGPRAYWLNNPNIRLVDLDGDGKADFMSIDHDGGVKGFMSNYQGGCNIGWTPISDGIEKGVAIMTAPDGSGAVRLADMDGDGKIDYAIIGSTTANLSVHKNTGKYKNVEPVLGGYGAAVRLADLDGDGRDDYISVDADGKAAEYKNGGLASNGGSWVWTEQGTGGLVAIGVGAKRHQVHFADLNGDGLEDYLVVDDEHGGVTAYLNMGSPGAWKPMGLILIGVGRDGGVGVRFADMNGDGRADYVYLDGQGVATVWLNSGVGDDIGYFKVMNNGAPAAIGVGANREDVRLADIDGDGLADYLWVHPDTGSVEVWYNGGPLGDALGWIHGGQIASYVGYPPQNMQFARIGTSGRADYVAIDEATGGIKVYVSTCSNVTKPRSATGVDDSACGKKPIPASGPKYYLPSGFDDGDAENWDCNLDRHFNNFDDLNAAADGLQPTCLAIYSMQVLSDMMHKAYDNYTDVNNGYDDLYGYYVKYVKRIIPEVLQTSFMFDVANTPVKQGFPELGPGMDYFDCVGGRTEGKHYPCSQLKDEFPINGAVAMTLRDKDGYEKALLDAGITADWVTLGDWTYVKEVLNGVGQTTTFRCKFSGFPIEADTVSVPDPKEIVSKGLPPLPDLALDIDATYADLMWGVWDGDVSDCIDAYSLPVFLLLQATDNMQQARNLGNKELDEEKAEAARKKNLILLIISVVLIFVPVIGEEVAAAAGLATLARTISLAGELGQAALDIYDTITTPGNALLNILGLLAGVGGLSKVSRDGAGIGKVAGIRRGMSSDDLALFGKIFSDNNAKVDALRQVCKL